jgi:D-aspartate ligase
MGKISVLIPDADDWIGIRVAYCLRASKQVVVHGLGRRKSWPFPLSRFFASFDGSENFDLTAWLSRIDEIVAQQRVDVVMPISSLGIKALSQHGRTLAFANKLVHLPDPDSFDAATNKGALAKVLAANSIPHPSTVVLASGSLKVERLSTLTFPVIAKPLLSSGGVGIKRFESRSELDAFLLDQGERQDWVIQEFVEGTDLCVNVLCENGEIIASTVQHAIIPPSVQYGPAPAVAFQTDHSAMDVAGRLMKALNWTGVANIDMRLGSQRETPLVLEVNGRYWLSLLGALHAGVNFPLLACEAAMGLTKSNRTPQNVRYFYGKRTSALSLLGGGQYLVRPGETDLGYYARDPLLCISSFMAKPVNFFHRMFLGPMRTMQHSSGNELRSAASERSF